MGINLQRLKSLQPTFHQTFSYFPCCINDLKKYEKNALSLCKIKISSTNNITRTGFLKTGLANFFSKILKSPFTSSASAVLTCIAGTCVESAKARLITKTTTVKPTKKACENSASLTILFRQLFFPHSCKNIFVHYIEKTNLLF